MPDQPEQETPTGNGERPSALRSMVEAGREVHQARSMSLLKALRLTLAKVSNDLYAMAAAVIGARAETRDGGAIADFFDPASLLILLDGPSRRRAAVALDASLVGALIQQQTMGKVLAEMPGDPRPLTATDAAISAPFLDALLTRAAPLPDDPAERRLIEGFRFGARVQDTRLLLMALEAPSYKVLHLTVDIDGGTRQGKIVFCFPEAEPDELDAVPDAADEEPVQAGHETLRLERQVLSLNAELHVALTSLRMPLSAVQDLADGDVLELGVTAFDHASVQTRGGRKLSRGTLGQIGGVRALQLEHAQTSARQPRRRASDRSELDLPRVSGDGTGTRAEEPMEDFGSEPQEAGGVPDLSELAATAPVPDLTDLPSLTDLPELPDMSDLPGFDELQGEPKQGTG